MEGTNLPSHLRHFRITLALVLLACPASVLSQGHGRTAEPGPSWIAEAVGAAGHGWGRR